MKKIVLISLIYLATNTSIFAVSSISDMLDYKFSSSVGNTTQTTDKLTIKSNDDKYKSLDNAEVTTEDVASKSSADSTEDEFSEGAMIYDVTSVGIKSNVKYKDCLQIKIFGQGTWQTYCQPVKKPQNCSDENWNNLKSLAILNC